MTDPRTLATVEPSTISVELTAGQVSTSIETRDARLHVRHDETTDTPGVTLVIEGADGDLEVVADLAPADAEALTRATSDCESEDGAITGP